MLGLGSIASLVGQFLGGPITAITGQLFGFLQKRSDTQSAELSTVETSNVAQQQAYLKAQTDISHDRVANNTHMAAQVMMFLFGLPVAFYFAMVYITAGLTAFGIHAATDPLHGDYLEMGKEIALSFFIVAPVTLVLSGLSSRMRS